MGRHREEPPPPPAPKCYVVRVDKADEQRALEALAAHQGRADVETWLRDLARGYVRRYFSRRMASDEGAEA